MNSKSIISTSRLEAFSDGVIAIILTVMVFDLKILEIPNEKNVWNQLWILLPKFISYSISYLMLSIMWINHHQLFHQIKMTNRGLLWFNIHLLFWMSMVPFATSFIGSNPFLWHSSFLYGIIFGMNAISFSFLRSYVLKANLLFDSTEIKTYQYMVIKNRFSVAIYFLGSLSSLFQIYVSFVLFLIVPLLYILPNNIGTPLSRKIKG